jgi:hypothetical protein
VWRKDLTNSATFLIQLREFLSVDIHKTPVDIVPVHKNVDTGLRFQVSFIMYCDEKVVAVANIAIAKMGIFYLRIP